MPFGGRILRTRTAAIETRPMSSVIVPTDRTISTGDTWATSPDEVGVSEYRKIAPSASATIARTVSTPWLVNWVSAMNSTNAKAISRSAAVLTGRLPNPISDRTIATAPSTPVTALGWTTSIAMPSAPITNSANAMFGSERNAVISSIG